MMSLNKYEVVTGRGCDEWLDYAGCDIREAIRVARANRKCERVEIRTNIDERDDGVDYDTIAFRIFVSIAETGDLLEECESLAEAERRIREMEDDDRLEGNYTPDYYAVTDEDGQPYRADLDGMTEEQAAVDANCIRRMRQQTGLNRKQFCDKYGIPYRTMQDWEDGKSKPVEWAEKLLRRAVRDDFPG